MKHEHTIVRVKSTAFKFCRVSSLVMDCPVQPLKVVVTRDELYPGHTFDPHLSNPAVIARFPPTEKGASDATAFAYHWHQ